MSDERYDPVFGREKFFRCSGSRLSGGVLWVYHRWHECNKLGHWLVTMCHNGYSKNIAAVVDDFGNLRMLHD